MGLWSAIYYLELYNAPKLWASNVKQKNTYNKSGVYRAFLDKEFLTEIIAFDFTLLWCLDYYECVNASALTTAGNEMFHGRLKNKLGRDETLKKVCSALPNFLVEELASKGIGERTFVLSRTNEYKNSELIVDDPGDASFR